MVADFDYELGAELQEIASLGSAVAAWGAAAHLTEPEIFQVGVIVEELVTNVIVHGLGIGRPGRIRLHLVRHRDAVILVLHDDAPPFDPFQAPPPDLTADIDARRVGGLGIHFVRSFATWWRYSRQAQQNSVVLCMSVGAPP
ncbi:MAG: ATP-binding protein [Gammaproteobacteria bacterium]